MQSIDDLKSNAVEAVLLLQGKINDNDDADSIDFRMLVPAKVIGCLIGKSGSIINEMRKRTKADVRISKGKKPKCAHDDDELVEVCSTPYFISYFNVFEWFYSFILHHSGDWGGQQCERCACPNCFET